MLPIIVIYFEMSKLKLSEFDLYGTFCLTKDETVGIENLVQKLGDNKYLSRNWSYYPKQNKDEEGFTCFREICNEYTRLNELLPMRGKPAFVICEKMHELAIRVVNTIQQKDEIHLFQDGEHFDTVAQKCAQECADNLVRLIHDQPAVKTATTLSDETRLHLDDLLDHRIVEADNKKQLYMCANALPDDVEHLITPGRGSSKLGTLVQSVRKHKGLKPLGFTQIYYSLYGNKQTGELVFSQPLKNLPENLLVMDDDIDTGITLSHIKSELIQQGHKITDGAMFATFNYRKFLGNHQIFGKPDWANYIDIIPNQFAQPFDQRNMQNCLKHIHQTKRPIPLISLLVSYPNRNGRDTADHIAMRLAEEKVQKFGADLYQVSEKISPAAVDYNKKFRAQVKTYNDEFQSLSK